MKFLRRFSVDKSVWAATVLLLCLLNFGQYLFGYGLVEGPDPWSLYFGIPFPYYDQGFKIESARILYLGAAGNLIFAIIAGFVAGVMAELLKKIFRGREWTPFFLTVALTIVLLNIGQYFMGYGGFGFAGEPEPTGLTLGFPFNYYYFSFLVYEGQMIYSGIIGNLMFAAGLGTVAGGLAALFRRSDSRRTSV